jgi:heterodisulfide reductase subunit A
VMIQCAGSRNADRPYCSRVCCTATVKNTITVIESVPDAAVTVLTRGFAQYVGDLDRAREAGVGFLRYDPERPPVVGPDAVRVFDVISSEEVSIPYDLVVLATPLVGREETAELARLFNLPVDDFCFVAEPHTKLRPGAFAPCGVFVAGSAHWPATVTECLSQAHAAAGRAASLIERGSIERLPLVARVDELACRGCERCVEVCVHRAPALREEEDGSRTSEIDEIRCVGCGVCVTVCPSAAITLSHLTQEQLLSMVGAAVGV